MTKVTELGYVRLGVSDLDAWHRFAVEGIGLEVHPDSTDDTVFLRLDEWHHRVILEKHDADELTGMGLRVAGAEELEAMMGVLDENGVSYKVADAELKHKRSVLGLITLEDPAGNPIELFHGPRLDTHLPFHPGRRMFGKFVTGDGGMGHMVVAHDDLDETLKFYKMLGMRGGIEYKISGPGDFSMEMMFMDCNSRDHAVAFGMPPKGRINHIMFEVDNLDDVYFTYEKLKKDYPITMTPGKHANDKMFSFYCQSPSGFSVEIGFGARDATYQSEYYVRDTYGHKLGATN